MLTFLKALTFLEIFLKNTNVFEKCESFLNVCQNVSKRFQNAFLGFILKKNCKNVLDVNVIFS